MKLHKLLSVFLALVLMLGLLLPAAVAYAADPVPTLTGDSLLSCSDGETSVWKDNSSDIRGKDKGFKGTFEGAAVGYTIWPLGSDRPGKDIKLQIISPDFTGDSTQYDSFSVRLLSWTNGTDPTLANLKFYYSTDGGTSWTEVPVTVADHGKLWTDGKGNTYTVWSHTAANVACPAAKITNVKLQPYGDTVNISEGAFRLISLDVTGAKSGGDPDPEPEPDPVPTPDPALPAISGDAVFAYAGGDVGSWSTNTAKVIESVGSVESAQYSSRVFALGHGTTGSTPLQITTPAFTVSTKDYKSFSFRALSWNNGSDPEQTGLTLAYSTDNGSTWTSVPVTSKAHGACWVSASSGNKFVLYSHTAVDLALPADAITHMKLQPYGGEVIKTGAFRLISLDVTASQREGTAVEPEPEPEPDPVRDDSAYIQGLIDSAVPGADGVKVVTVPKVNPNDPEGGSVYQIGKAIEIPSNTTVKLDNCTLRLNDGVLCNIFISDGLYDGAMTEADEVKNIKIIGLGTAVLDGGKHNGVTEKTATKPDGYSTVRHNHSIFFRNVDGFEISNLQIVEPRYWGICFNFCENGTVSGIHFDCSNKAPNQDGIDLRIGCNNITIENITGVTGDDTVALTALSSAGGSDVYFAVSGKSSDIHDVTMKNIKATCNGGHGIIRLLCHHDNKVYNIHMENIEDTGSNHVQGVLRIGDTNYAGSGTPMKYGDMYNVTIDGVISNGTWAIHAPNKNVTNKHVTYKNITTKYGGVTNLTIEEDPIEPTPITYLTGDSIFAYTGGSEEGWGSNAGRAAVTNSGKLEEKAAVATVWPLGSTAANTALAVTTPKFTVDSKAFESYKVHMVVLDNGDDPDLSKLILSVSTDEGRTWTDVPLTMTKHGGIWKKTDGTTWEVHDYVSGDLAELVEGTVTHMRVKPFGDQYIRQGAFRLISMDVKGEKHTLTHYDQVPATCTAEGKKEYWYCADCHLAFSDAAGTKPVAETDLILAKAAHSMTHHAAAEPTCKADGNLEYWHCGVCKKSYSDAEGKNILQNTTLPKDPDAHKLTEVAAQPATLKQDGNIAHWTCSVCGKCFADAAGEQALAEGAEVIDAIGYDLEAMVASVKDVTAENVAASKEDDLKDVQAELEELLEDYGDELTAAEKQAVEAELTRIEAALQVLEDAAAAAELMKALPAEASPDDADALNQYFAASEAYEALSDHGKTLVGNVAIKKLTDLAKALTDYKVLEGDKSQWTIGSGKTLTIKVNGMFSKFQQLEVDGKKVDASNYTLKEGSTILTLKADYLKTLKAGKHTFALVYPDGRAEGTFTVKAASEGSSTTTPQTGDPAKLLLWAAVLTAAAAAVILLIPRKRKYRA